MNRIVILGAGGHAQVVADIILAMRKSDQDVDLVGFLDDEVALHGKLFLGLPVLGAINKLDGIPHDSIVVAIGKNGTRREIAERLTGQGERLVAAIHPSAVLGTTVSVVPGAMICAGVVVNTASRIGGNVPAPVPWTQGC
ncbi:MAG: hypothetical protein LLG45_09265 [Actinomycetia bacterium]|nr:hypothetical protein [Actinomycetes bacterium]